MKEKKEELRAAGYVRVSSIGQTENESLPEQRRLIKEYCTEHKHKLTKIYADKGISGTTTKDRLGILEAIEDARAGKFDILIVRDASRFGRELYELLQNHRALKNAGVELVAVKEDLQNKMLMQLKGMFAEQEIESIKGRMMSGRIEKALRGIPTNGTLPFGRTYDRKAEVWGIDENKKQAMEWVYKEYVKKDRSLQQIAIDIESQFGFSIHYQNLVEILKEKCGTEWEINFKEHPEPIKYEIPRILSESKIQAIKDRLAHNRTNNRTDTKDYLLAGFLRCQHCGKTLSGHTQHGKYQYYKHQHMKPRNCHAFNSVSLKKVEKEVFEMIFDDIGDMASFEKAIKDSLPDEKYIEELEQDIQRKKKRLGEVNKEWDNVKKSVREGIYKKDEVLDDINELRESRELLTNEINEVKHLLDNLPDPEAIRKEAHRIRIELLEKYESIERLNEMSLAEKKRLLHFLFDGKAPKGKGYGGHNKYGIYIDKKGKGQSAEYNYWLFGRLKALKHKDEDGGKGGRTPLFDVGNKSSFGDSAHKKSLYKTNNFSSRQNEQGIF